MVLDFLRGSARALFDRPQKRQQAAIYPAGTFWGINFDGEQEPGALNCGYVYDVDYYTLAQRAYTLVTINEFARLMILRLVEFVVGTGLKLHPTPLRGLLKRMFGIQIPEDFAKNIQEIWSLIEDDKNISITKDQNIHALARTVYYNGLIAGDILVIKRIVNKNLEYQLVNGLSVKSSLGVNSANGNKIIDGVEIDKNETPVAYYVVDKDGKENRIEARDNKERLIAWLVPCGIKRLNSTRAYSILGAIMQKLHKIGQYSNAEVMAAETNAKFAAWIEQDKESSGVNPIKNIPGISRLIENQGIGGEVSNDTTPGAVERFKNSLKRIASGLFIHMPRGQKLNSFDTKRPNVNYTQFLDGSMKYNCASSGVPFEVATMQFSNNFSASRAALKMFEVILLNNRQFTIVDYFYQPVYEQMFELECLKNNIDAPRYLQLKNDDGYLDNAYTKAKFVGVKIPHIDEVKEVNAVLSKLKGGLITFEQALEDLGIMTDFDTIIERRKIEEEKIKKAGLNFETLFAPDGGGSNDDDTEIDKKEITRRK